MSGDGISSQVAGLRVLAIKAALEDLLRAHAQSQAGIDAMEYRLQAIKISEQLFDALLPALPPNVPVMVLWRAVACLLARIAVASDSDEDKICNAFMPLLRLELSLARDE